MQVFEQIIAIVAPHYCIECRQEGQPLCTICVQEILSEITPACIFCDYPTLDGKLCTNCRRLVPLERAWVLGAHENVLASLIHVLKFERVRAAGEVLAHAFDQALPPLPVTTLVAPLPTAPRRIRQRGYDQSQVIAQAFAKRRNMSVASVLTRTHSTRQVGATRSTRETQAKQAYGLSSHQPSGNPPLLLVDDVMTTGASLKAAANLLYAAGFTHLMAIVAAKQPFKK